MNKEIWKDIVGYEELYYKGYVEEGKEVKDYLQTDKKEKKED